MCIPTKFHASISIYSKVIAIPTVEAWSLEPQSKNSTRGNFFEKVCILSFSAYQKVYFYQVSCFYHNLQQSYCNDYLEAWNLAPQSKNSIRGHFLKRSVSYLFQRIKMCIPTKFHASISIYSKVIVIPTVEAWSLVPQSKNSIRGHFFEGVCILSFSAYQTVYPYQVSCFYHNLHDFFTDSPD